MSPRRLVITVVAEIREPQASEFPPIPCKARTSDASKPVVGIVLAHVLVIGRQAGRRIRTRVLLIIVPLVKAKPLVFGGHRVGIQRRVPPEAVAREDP